MSEAKVNASGVPSGAEWRGLKLFLDAEVGHRSGRDGFPAATSLPLGADSIEIRRQFLAELVSPDTDSRKFARIRGLQVSREEYAAFGAIALDYVAALAEARGGICPPFNELMANLAHDPRVGHVNSPNFETTMRVLLSAYFSKKQYGPPLWSGSVENLYHAVTSRFPDDHARFPGKNIPGALLSVINEAPEELFNTRELVEKLGGGLNDADLSTMVDRGLQLLLHSGDIVQHPHHVAEPGSNVTCCVWSSKSGPWVKPPLLSPVLQVLHVAARPEGVAVRAGQRVREYDHAVVRDEARDLVSPWSKVPVGARIDSEVYNPLRRVLVTRKPFSLVDHG